MVKNATPSDNKDNTELKNRIESLLPIFGYLSRYAMEHTVLSEGELAMKIKECVGTLSDTERKELEREFGRNLEDVIFTSITSEEKISVFSPDMHTRINYQGEIFYCLPTHRYLSKELEEAFTRWTQIRSPPRMLKGVVEDFIERCGYQIEEHEMEREGDYLALSAVKKENKHRSMNIFILPSITFASSFIEEQRSLLERSEAGEEKVIVVPTEKTPAPFITFIREHDVGDTLIWVVDVERRTIDPLIGISKDNVIENSFANPEQARRAVSIWMKKMHFADLD
jgi:hypothetical protein